MVSTSRRTPALAALLLAAAALGGCTQVRGHQGYYFDPTLVATIAPGVDNKESVTKTLGHPSFRGEFTDNDWYYVSRETRQLAFSTPHPVEQQILHVSFDGAGNVATVDNMGMQLVSKIHPYGKVTPSLGRKRGFFEDLFGNIGQVGTIPGGSGGGRDGRTP